MGKGGREGEQVRAGREVTEEEGGGRGAGEERAGGEKGKRNE